MAKRFHVLIEQDEDGGYVGRVPELQGCLSQGDTLDELMKNIKEAIELCLEAEAEEKKFKFIKESNFVGIQEITV
jgi:predicted RNase H-like HicB family nuclease